MKTESLATLIDDINNGTGNDRIFQRPLMANVSLGIVWTEYPEGESAFETGDTFYFVYADNGSCIAAIYVMGTVNLHVFVKDENRRRGVMTRALRDIVLPHLFTSDRKEQKATFESTEALGMLKKVGFTILDKTNAVIKKEQVQNVDFPDLQPIPFPKERMKALKKRVYIAAGLLRMANDELSLYPCGSLSEDVMMLAEDVDDIAIRVEDEWWRCHKHTE